MKCKQCGKEIDSVLLDLCGECSMRNSFPDIDDFGLNSRSITDNMKYKVGDKGFVEVYVDEVMQNGNIILTPRAGLAFSIPQERFIPNPIAKIEERIEKIKITPCQNYDVTSSGKRFAISELEQVLEWLGKE